MAARPRTCWSRRAASTAQGKIHVSAMPTCTTPTGIAARRRTSSSPRPRFEGSAGDPAAIAAEMDKITEVARGHAADQEPHRRLDLQEPARPQGLATDRRGRLPRADRRRRAGVGTALQLPDQSRHRDRGRHRDSGRNRAQAREGQFRRRRSNGRSSGSAYRSVRPSRVFVTPRNFAAHSRLCRIHL